MTSALITLSCPCTKINSAMECRLSTQNLLGPTRVCGNSYDRLINFNFIPKERHSQRRVWSFSSIKHRGMAAMADDTSESSRGEAENKGSESLQGGINDLKDWREFRARLIRSREPTVMETPENLIPTEENAEAVIYQQRTSWAHSLVKPEQGCLVIAHPGAFGESQQYFHQSVIFLLWHSDQGSAGVILNRPTEYTLGQVAGFEEVLPELSDCPLYMGGDVGTKSTHVVHCHGDMEGVKEILPGVYVGGYHSLKEHVRSGKSEPGDYRWFARYAGWGPGQLEREVEAGVWFLGSCSADLILKHTSEFKKSMWVETMALMGGEYAELARRISGEL